ncbi:hypothetical protein D3C85_1305340 [compost metagenome]
MRGGAHGCERGIGPPHQRQRHPHHHAARGVFFHLHAGRGTEDPRQALAHMGQAHARALAVALAEAHAGIGDDDLHAAVAGIPGRQCDLSAIHTRLDAMRHRVLHQRLDQHRRNLGLGQRRRQINLECEPRAKAHALDIEIAAQQLELLLQRALLRPRVLQRHAQEADQPLQ